MVGGYTAEQRLQLARSRGIIVDAEDEWLLSTFTWHINQGYVITQIYLGWDNIREQSIQVVARLHHCIVGQPILEGEEIDHINRNPLDNRRCNLRYVDHFTQTMNNRRVLETKNVYYHSRDDCYDVIVTRKKVRHYLGRFATLDEAVATRDEWLHNEELADGTR